MAEEMWKAIPGYEGMYEASSRGRIRSLNRKVPNRWGTLTFVKGRVLKPAVSHDGYLRAELSKEGDKKKTYVSRLVCMAFNGLPENDAMLAAHKNGTRDDNRPENLEWRVSKDTHALRKEHGTWPAGELNSKAKLNERKVCMAKSFLEKGFTHGVVAAMLGVSKDAISDISSGRNWAHVTADDTQEET